MKEAYFVIHASEDGDIYATKETKASLVKQLNPNEYGDVEIVAADVLDSLPDTINIRIGMARSFLSSKGRSSRLSP